jgi:CopG family transcriptional regulator, nickel-responsive regulator
MSELRRFSVSLDKNLITRFDKHIREKNYSTRSKAIGDLISEDLVKEEWIVGKEVAGTITLVYNHHRRELVNRLVNIQHEFHDLVLSSQHLHLDGENCLEIIAVNGNPEEVGKLASKLKATKGVKHSSLTMATTGKSI